MAIDSGMMASAFEVGAGFSAERLSFFMATLLAIIAVVWAMILLVGWLEGAQKAPSMSRYLTMRLAALGFLFTLLMAMLGSPT